jgi:exonuclease SbcC
MIKEISIKNYQSHKDSILSLHEGVNFILGTSDSGKSAIIRAIKWVKDNRPSGEEFRSNWGGKTEVEIFTDDAHIVRSKDKENEYILGDIHFKAFGTDVPKEISDALNLNESNISFQLDSPFLLSETPGNVAQYWNQIANLSAIDKGTSNINSAIRELTADIKYKEGQEVKLTEDLKAFEFLEQFESEVSELEELEKQSQKLDLSFRKLYQWQASYYEIKTKLEYHQKTLELEKPLNIVLNLIEERAKKDLEQVKLDRIVSQIRDIQAKINEQSKLITLEKPVSELLQLHKDRDLVVERRKQLSTIVFNIQSTQTYIKAQESLTTQEKPVLALLDLIEQRNKTEESKLGLFRIVSSLRTIQTRITNGDKYVKDKEAEFEKEMPVGSICKLCGQKINGKN